MLIALLLAQVTMNLASPQQAMDGFGCSMVELLNPGTTTQDQLFSQSKGIGLNILRIGIASSDMGDGFPPSHGRDGWPGTQSQIVNAKEFLARQPTGKVWAEAWSAPATCKSGSSLNSGSFLTACNTSWSTFIGDTIDEFQNSGVSIYMVGAQNEPDNDPAGAFPGMTFTAANLTNWIKVLQPVLAGKSHVPILGAPSTAQWSNLSSYVTAITADSTALGEVGVWVTHQYGTPIGSVSSPPTLTGRNLWVGEVSNSPVAAQDTTLADGIAKAIWIHNALTTGQASAYVTWRCVNSQNDSLIDGNAPFSANVGGTPTFRYWVLGNYSKFIQPGMVRFPFTGSPPANVSISSFKAPTSNNIAVVAINNQASTQSLTVTLDSASRCRVITPWVTDATHNLTSVTLLSVAASAFTYTLTANSVTTFVCNGT